MSLTTYPKVDQGSAEWHDLRRGMVTASEAGRLITPKTVKVAENIETRALTLTLIAERITGWTDPTYVSGDMERGWGDEPLALDKYAEHNAPVEACGFMVRDDWGFQIGYSPDALVGDDGLVEVKSRAPKKHLQTILADEVPAENMAQLQCGLLVSGRSWIDYVSYCGGMPLYVSRVLPDPAWFEAIVAAAQALEDNAAQIVATYRTATKGLPKTERIDYNLVELNL